jgi:hypothetical protein
MTFPSFSVGETLRAADMNSVGLWLVKTQTVGTAVSTVTVTGAFSADYDNYKIVYSGGVCSTGLEFRMSLGSTTTGYFNSLIYGTTYATPTPAGIGTNNGALWSYVGWGETTFAAVDVDLYHPFLARHTTFRCPFMGDQNTGHNSGIQKSTTSFTTVTLVCSTGTFSGGTISVYGYKK